MLEIKLTVQWLDSLREWRVVGSSESYWPAKGIDEIPAAIRGMLRSEGETLVRAAEKAGKE